jgi:hypothetical protein
LWYPSRRKIIASFFDNSLHHREDIVLDLVWKAEIRRQGGDRGRRLERVGSNLEELAIV